MKFWIQPFLFEWCQCFSIFFSWLLGFWLCCSCFGFFIFAVLLFVLGFLSPLCSHSSVITERHWDIFLLTGEVCAVLSQKMVCHGEHTYLFAQSMMSILAQEEQGGSAVRRIAQEVQRYAHEKWVELWIRERELTTVCKLGWLLLSLDRLSPAKGEILAAAEQFL